MYWRVLFNTAAGRRIDSAQRWWKQLSWPRTVDEAVVRLYRQLSPRERRTLAGPEDAIGWFSFSMGGWNEFGL